MDMRRTTAKLQDFYVLSIKSIGYMFRRPFYLNETVDQMNYIGVGSLLLVILVSLFIGLALSLQISIELSLLGLQMYTGNIVGMAIIREIGPVSIGLAFAGRVGSGMASEIGSMVIGHQVDVLRVYGILPLKKLVIPRVLSCLVMLPLLTIIGDAVAILGSYYIAIYESHQSGAFFWSQIRDSLTMANILSGLLKPVIFGYIIACVSCYTGLATSGGAKGLRKATTQAVVISSIAIIITDFMITRTLMLLLGEYA
jgi:phospholipid/cholesterol/gamma-HCH transport system permease protein